MLLIITSTGDRLFSLTSMTLNDLEPPKRGFSEFFAISGCTAHFNTELRQNGWRYQDNLSMKFSALNADFSSPSPDPLGSRRPAQAGVKDSYPPP